MTSCACYVPDLTVDTSTLLCLIVQGSAQSPVLPHNVPADIPIDQLQDVCQGMDFSTVHARPVPIRLPQGIQWIALCTTGENTDALALQAFASTITSTCTNLDLASITLQLDHVRTCFDTNIDAAFLLIKHIHYCAYTFTRYTHTQHTPQPKVILQTKQHELESLARANAINDGIDVARDVANTAPNDCTVAFMRQQCQELAESFSDVLRLQIVDQNQMQKLGFGAFLAVAKGSRQEAALVVLEYKHPNAKSKPIALLGKGIVFDTGGISLKPPATMDEMKFDMCGSAAVLGSCKAICALAPQAHIIFALALAENMPGGNATRPGDIVTTLSGKTVEILNTDAEGRLVLCDSLTWLQQQFQPKTIIDIATLTGACVIALGHHASALYANNDEVANDLLNASTQVYDGVWRMPLWREYQQQLSSNICDIPNISSGRDAGSITAACFLSRFIENNTAWAHLDIAGTAWKSGKNKLATGRPASLLTQYILNSCHHNT